MTSLEFPGISHFFALTFLENHVFLEKPIIYHDSLLGTSNSHKTSQQQEHVKEHTASLRKTPLRNSIDSYNRLLEVHRHTIDKISHEVSRLVCNCQQLDATTWNDYERNSDVIQLGLTGYTVVPVSCNCLLYTSPSPRDGLLSRMPSSA